MSHKKEDVDTYIIPPNFIDAGTVFGGMFKLRNVIEAGVIVAVIGLPVFRLPLSLTTKIIIICVTALPLALFALIGIAGESLSSFLLGFIHFQHNKRVVGNRADAAEAEPEPRQKRKKARKAPKASADFAEEFSDVPPKTGIGAHIPAVEIPHNRRSNTVADYLPVKKIANGCVYTSDHRYVRILEISPINFSLRSQFEQRNIIYSFIGYLKISPAKVHIKVITKKADINRHLEIVHQEMEAETDERCRELQRDYEALIRRIGSKEAITRRFFLVFEYEPIGRRYGEEEAIASLATAVATAKTYLAQCGNNIIEAAENEDEAVVSLLYDILNRKSSAQTPLSKRTQEVLAKHLTQDTVNGSEEIPATEFFAPPTIDFTHGRYIKMDNTYYSYLLIPSTGYRSHVYAGWTALLVNAGEGIDLDIYLQRQPKEQIARKLGQQLRINRSKLKDANDTNTDFDDLEGAIQSGYFLKEGLAENQDFYYLTILVTVSGDSVQELEWRVAELKKLLVSQDLDCTPCLFRQEQAFLSSLPLAALDKHLFERGKRNVLTLGAASCYPFVSYELSDDNGILLGVNLHNNSLVITDIFNSKIYKNANMAILGTSGAGKSFTLQLISLRMRRKGIQVFILAPLKGHEFYRAAKNIGGEIIQISPSSPHCINIMEIRPVDTTVSKLLDETTIEKSLLASKIQRLHIFFSLLVPDINYEEKQLLDDAFIRVYKAKGITHDNSSLVDSKHPDRFKPMPVLGDLYKVLLQSPATKRLANILNRLVNGSAATFNQQTNVDLNSRYIVLDISELTGDLLAVGMFIGLDYVWDKCKEDRTVEKAIFIDEIWQLLGSNSSASNHLAAEFTLEIFKVIRGYGGAAVCASQDISDFFALDDGKFGRGIINNARTKIILNMEDDEARRVQSILHLSETETMAITHFERGSGLISSNNNNITVEFKASDLEKELITTDRSELQAILRRKQHQENHAY